MPERDENLALMRRIRQQDEDALAELYDQYGGQVYSVAYYVLRDRRLAEEVAQDVFLTTWRNPAAWNPNKGRLVSWLLTIARRRAIDVIRKEKRKVQVVVTPVEELIAVASHDEVGNPQTHTRNAHLRRLVGQLDPRQFEVVQLAYFWGMTHQEIADYLELPLGTVKSRLRAGVQALRVSFEHGE